MKDEFNITLSAIGNLNYYIKVLNFELELFVRYRNSLKKQINKQRNKTESSS